MLVKVIYNIDWYKVLAQFAVMNGLILYNILSLLVLFFIDDIEI